MRDTTQLQQAHQQAPREIAAIYREEDGYWSPEAESFYRLAWAQVPGLLADQQALREALQQAADALENTAAHVRDTANDLACDAGNFDGGSTWTCEHCQALQHADYLAAAAQAARITLRAGQHGH